MKLYYWPKTRAFRALWMLEELGVPYEFAYVNIRAGEQNEAAFCAVNPMSKLPALDDEFARDLGDYQTLDELKDAVRKTIFHEKQYAAQQVAKESLIDRLLENNDFPIPEAYVDRQIENQVRMQLRDITGRGIDPSTLNLDWAKLKESQRDKAVRNVKASLLLERVAEKEGIHASKEEVDREVQRLARQEREAIPVTRAKLEKDGTLGRISGHIQTEKTLLFLFDQAQKHA